MLHDHLLTLSIYFQEKRREEEEAEVQLNMQLAQEAAHAKLARDLCNEVKENLLLKLNFGSKLVMVQ